MFLVKNGKHWFLRKWEGKYPERKQINVISFGRHKPTFHKPQLFNGDAREILKQIKPLSVNLVITSPPYYNLKETYWENYSEYTDMLNEVWEGCYSVLDNSCRLCVNIGDQYTDVETYGRHYAIPIHADIIKGCQKIGFDYMGAFIWNKRKTLRSSGGGVFLGSYPHPREFLPSFEYEYILIFKKSGKGKMPSDKIKKASRLKKSEWGEYFDARWSFVGEKKKMHSSAFPEELPKRLIRIFSFWNETVLDPFMGSGTTPLVASKWGRKGIGIELNKSYFEKAQQRINNAKIPYLK